MVLETFLHPDSQLAIPLMLPVSGSRGILVDALSSRTSLKYEDHLNSILGMAQWNPNLVSDVVTNSTILGESSTSAPDVDPTVSNLTLLSGGVSFRSHVGSYISLPSSPMSFPSENSMTDLSTTDTLARSCQKNRERKQVGKSKLKLQTHQDSVPLLKKPRLDVHQDKFQQHQIIQELLLKELQDRNAQIKATIMQQNQLQTPILHSVPQISSFQLVPINQQMRSLLQDQGSQPGTFTPLLDGGVCSRRVMQYLYHLRNLTQANSITYWKNFVSEYYAPGARKRWCFSNYIGVQQHATGVFCPKVMEMWCCDICGSRSGKGLEASFDVIPRLFKIKFESGVLDQILFLDLPQACRIQSGLVLEYQKAVQQSVYENSRVVHEGKLRIVFRHDLKILSWEFCALNHEDFLLHRLVAPQVTQLVQAAEIYQNDNHKVSLEDLQTNCEDIISAGDKLARTMETPLVNELGYPKRFIRCLQISEVANSLKDLMDITHDRKMGPIESLNKFFKRAKTGNQTKDKQECDLFSHANPGFLSNGIQMTENAIPSASRTRGLTFVNSGHQLIGKSQHHEHVKSPHQALVDKWLHDMAAANRGKSNDESQPYQNSFTSLLKGPMHKPVTSNELCSGESSNISIKQEPHSPDWPEYLQNLSGLSRIGDLEW